MTAMRTPDSTEPLARYHGTKALAYVALGATFFLETLTNDDEQRLQSAIEHLWEWFGCELKWCLQSFNARAAIATREELEYIPTYARNFPLTEERYPLVSTLDEYSVRASSGQHPGEAGPFQVEFYGAIDWAQENQPGVVRSVLGFCVADDCDVVEFERRTRQLAALLNLRWGVAGHRYAYSDAVSSYAAADARWAHARRYSGYDLAEYVGAESMHRLYDRIPSVNWLTWLGPGMMERVRDSLASHRDSNGLQILLEGAHTLVKAGEHPERGDLNRFEIPAAYVAADRLLRGIRLDDGEALCVPATNWSPEAMLRWLQRFEHP